MWMIIDRFEGDFALLENPESREVLPCPRASIPAEAREGSVLARDGSGAWQIDAAQTAARAAAARGHLERLKAKTPPTRGRFR